jgi:hypothetical protein
MAAPLRIFLSYELNDAELAQALKKQLAAAFPGRSLIYWERAAPVDPVHGADRFLERASLAIILWSVDYSASGESLLDKERIKKWERERRPFLPVLVAYMRSATLPPDLLAFEVAPASDEPVVQTGVDRDRQLFRVAQAAAVLVQTAPGGSSAALENPVYEPPYTIEDARERLAPLTRRQNLTPLFHFLKSIVYDARVRKHVFELEDAYTEAYQRARLEKAFDLLIHTVDGLRAELRHLIATLEEVELVGPWRGAFARFERGGTPLFTLYYPSDEIVVPATLDSEGDLESGKAADFRRLLLLSQDALALGNFAQAHAYAEQVRTGLEAESAQLYEFLLVSYVHLEKPDVIVRDALHGTGHLFNHVVLYAGRLREYQAEGKCPSRTAAHNLRAVAEDLSDYLWTEYDALPNDHVLDTGKRAEEVADARTPVEKCLHTAQTIYRAIDPYQGFLKTLVLELAGGGKIDWIDRVELSPFALPSGRGHLFGEGFRFASRGEFDVESTIVEILEMLDEAEPARTPGELQLPGQTVAEPGDAERSALFYQLREDLYYSLLAKRKALSQQLAWEQRRLRHYSDERLAVIRYVHACLLGYRIFGDQGNDHDKEQSFLRLAIEYLLPNLIRPDAPGGSAVTYDFPRDLRWFDLDESGAVYTHGDVQPYRFDAYGLLQTVVNLLGGAPTWLHVHPNINASIYQQYAADTQAGYALLRQALSYTDFRRIDDLKARRGVIECLNRWVICYRAFPEHGQTFLEESIRELVGDGLLLWMHFNPYELVPHADSLTLGYDSVRQLRALSKLTTRLTEVDIQHRLAENLFARHIQPTYARVPAGDETQRTILVSLLIQTLNGYREYPQPVYLDFVFQELTEETKLRWITVDLYGTWQPYASSSQLAFDPVEVILQLNRISPERYKLYDIRRTIANRRFADLQAEYRREISDLRTENGRYERAVAIDIIRRLKGLYQFFPDTSFLELPIRELSGNGNIRWNERFLGVFPTTTNHYESNYYEFDYKVELAIIKELLRTQHERLERVMRETGYI